MRAAIYSVLIAVAVSGCDQSAAPISAKVSASGNESSQSSAVAASTPIPPIGRYTIIHSPEVERDTMLLDTATGRTWQLVQVGSGDNGALAWEAVNRPAGDQ